MVRKAQTVVMGVVFFLNFCAYYILQGLASDLLGNSLASVSLASLYAVFTVSCLLAPAAVRRYGSLTCLRLGIGGYLAFAAAALFLALTGRGKLLVVVGGALNGFGAALLWTAQGERMIALAKKDPPLSAHFAIFWAFFNASAVVGGIATFAYLSNHKPNPNVDAHLFTAFLFLMLLAAVFTVFLDANSHDTQRDTIDSMRNIQETLKLLKRKRVILLAPVYFYTGFSQPYQLETFGNDRFSAKLLGLELALFYGCAVLAGYIANALLTTSKNLRQNAISTLTLFGLTSAPGYMLASLQHASLLKNTIVFALWGFSVNLIQAYCYWLIGALYPKDQSDHAVALYKFIQSLGWCLGFILLPPKTCSPTMQLLLTAANCLVAAIFPLFELPRSTTPSDASSVRSCFSSFFSKRNSTQASSASPDIHNALLTSEAEEAGFGPSLEESPRSTPADGGGYATIPPPAAASSSSSSSPRAARPS